ncbi:MAG: HPr family phosphocarrier protein, partial [Oscillospiraceae bacterium]|nr:HPr family phosphocarrier protein [Oscillospiraceae bacterium]
GTAIRIIADGTDEEQAVASLVELVDSGFSDESR